VSDDRPSNIASVALVLGAALGIAGTFVPSASLRGLAWGIDGVSLIVASSLLCVRHARQERDLMAAGFLVFAVGEALIVSASAMTLDASTPFLGAGGGLWAASLAMVSFPRVLPLPARILGILASGLFAIVAARIFSGAQLTPLSAPLPFFAYPFLAATLLAWAWVYYERAGTRS